MDAVIIYMTVAKLRLDSPSPLINMVFSVAFSSVQKWIYVQHDFQELFF